MLEHNIYLIVHPNAKQLAMTMKISSGMLGVLNVIICIKPGTKLNIQCKKELTEVVLLQKVAKSWKLASPLPPYNTSLVHYLIKRRGFSHNGHLQMSVEVCFPVDK